MSPRRIYKIQCGSETHRAWLDEAGSVVFESHIEAVREIEREAALSTLGEVPPATYEGCLRVARVLAAGEPMTGAEGDARLLIATVEGMRQAQRIQGIQRVSGRS
jgi:hypothetical protein